MHDTGFLSDYFLDLIIVEGDWTNLNILSQDPNYSKYFDSRGLRVDRVDAFLSLDEITLVGAFTGTIIPDFIDNNGANQNLETIVNAAVGLTGTFIAINNAKIEDYANSIRKIDTIGNNLINTTDDTIDFLSYNTPIKNILEYSGETDLNTGSTDLTTYTGLAGSTSNIYIKSYPFGGRSGKFNNVLVIPKPQPGDTIFLPSQYQFILDSLTPNSIIKTFGTDELNSEAPSDFVKVENVIDTGINDIQNQNIIIQNQNVTTQNQITQQTNDINTNTNTALSQYTKTINTNTNESVSTAVYDINSKIEKIC